MTQLLASFCRQSIVDDERCCVVAVVGGDEQRGDEVVTTYLSACCWLLHALGVFFVHSSFSLLLDSSTHHLPFRQHGLAS